MSNAIETIKVNDELFLFRHWMPTPFGFLAITSYAILGKEPILVDTQAPIVRDAFLDAVSKVVDPKDVRSVFITHDDRDHTGNLMQVLERCPNANFLCPIVGAARLGEEFALPMNRIRLVNPGEAWEANGRSFSVIRPAFYDSPSTVGLFDPKHQALFAADCFGGFVPKPTHDARDVPVEEYTRGYMFFNTANSPWIHLLKGTADLSHSVKELQSLAPKTIFSTHGPVITGPLEDTIKLIYAAVEAPQFKGPSHDQFMQMMAAAAPPA